MAKAYIFLNGNPISEKCTSLCNLKNGYIIVVDGGANYIQKFNRTPDILIGDLDSIKPEVLRELQKKKVKTLVYQKEKDQTDSEIAVQYALESGFMEVNIVGFFGSRIDHMISLINYLTKVANKAKIRLIQEFEDMYFVDKHISFDSKAGDEISLIPLKTDTQGVTTSGLYYKLKDETLDFASTRGVSNIASGKKVVVSLKNGTLLVVHRKSLAI